MLGAITRAAKGERREQPDQENCEGSEGRRAAGTAGSDKTLDRGRSGDEPAECGEMGSREMRNHPEMGPRGSQLVQAEGTVRLLTGLELFVVSRSVRMLRRQRVGSTAAHARKLVRLIRQVHVESTYQDDGRQD
jgi:hypothetical protein